MRILYINQYFIPEVEPSASKVFELSKEFTKKGHKVKVITGFLNYPCGNLYSGYKLIFGIPELVKNGATGTLVNPIHTNIEPRVLFKWILVLIRKRYDGSTFR